MNDLRYGVRALTRMRGVAVTAIGTLALGIAATTAMFSAADAALLRPLPFANPDRLVLLFTTRTTASEGLVLSRWSRPLIDALIASVTSYESIASFTPSLVSISGGSGDPEQIDGEIVSPEYFETLRVTAAVGRTFTSAEDGAPGDAQRVVRVGAGDRYVSNAVDPCAERRRARRRTASAHVPDVGRRRNCACGDAAGRCGIAAGQLRRYVVKTRGLSSALVPALRRAVASIDPSLPIYDVLSLDDRIAGALSRPRFNAALVAGFAGTALLIAAIGVYGMLSYSVSSRLREIGVRLALGAAPQRIVRFVLAEGLRLAILGLTIGLLAALAVGRLTRSLVVDVSPSDPRILAAVAGVMLFVACLAAFLPARRASAVDPIVVLRQE